MNILLTTHLEDWSSSHLNKMKKIILLIFIILTSSCSTISVSVQPKGNYLPDAIVGKSYNASISIVGGPVIVSNEKKFTNFVIIEPADSGMEWKPHKKSLVYSGKEESWEDYNHLVISGKPLKSGEIYVTVVGRVYGTMLTGSGKFQKKYTIKVNEK
ncbi:hypothetical protein [Xenorhabdus griffiniae]|uniref:hypothetical protein n=1 Tax=Xenorhabdus griffiniae TaxID=351672 RepID=UPI00235A1BD0|nr:hypothetical protein [Xenorhabdus griffiniae]MDC9606834.1 hypothetical protein [Xenorhabdus griffiniae]